ncbi:Rieske (2Fe-2S) protein [Kitasatospora brasiliensis]|uniref:Rieske (2Fe-2S) protein n=1 Tax=Kitasatospora brasiliensis TaxID=3058040 RepID=UPI00292D8E86|nr:Rieske (2Fe-2S) protein [Kitasatospora sp. K002]
MSEAPETSPTASRRTLLCGAAALAAGGTVAVTGCASSAGEKGPAKGSLKGPVDLGPASEVPEGGGKVYREQKVVVTQPTAGEYKAFDARCTHAGCLVDQVKNDQILCPCHGSRFAAADGTVKEGPAKTALPAYTVTVEAGNLKVTPS